MAAYELGARTVNRLAATPACEIRATSANAPRLMELGFSQTGTVPTTQAVYGLGRPAAVGVAPTTSAYAQDTDDNSGINALASIAVAWGTAPTVPANFFRRCSVNNDAAGRGYLWSFPRGIRIPVSGSLVLWIISTMTPSDLDVWAVVDE